MTAVEDYSQRAFKAYNSPFCIRGASSYLSPTCSTARCQKNYFERPQSAETRNKKQEEKRKLNRKNWKGNLLILEILFLKIS